MMMLMLSFIVLFQKQTPHTFGKGTDLPAGEEEEEEEEEGLFKADAVNEEDPERDRATQV